jgi:hypothetical protein
MKKTELKALIKECLVEESNSDSKRIELIKQTLSDVQKEHAKLYSQELTGPQDEDVFITQFLIDLESTIKDEYKDYRE